MVDIIYDTIKNEKDKIEYINNLTKEQLSEYINNLTEEQLSEYINNLTEEKQKIIIRF